jgi:hypothetical protein
MLKPTTNRGKHCGRIPVLEKYEFAVSFVDRRPAETMCKQPLWGQLAERVREMDASMLDQTVSFRRWLRAAAGWAERRHEVSHSTTAWSVRLRVPSDAP